LSKKKRYSVYKLTSPKGKIYIGITSILPEARWKDGKGYDYNIYLSSDIKMYGWDNFKHEILFCGLSEAEAKQKEIELIDKYNSTNFLQGYNIEHGGDLRKGRSYKAVKCLTTNICFSSIKEAGEFYNIRKKYITNCLTGRASFAGEFNGKKLTWAYVKERM